MGKGSPPFLLSKFYARADLADWRAFLFKTVQRSTHTDYRQTVRRFYARKGGFIRRLGTLSKIAQGKGI